MTPDTFLRSLRPDVPAAGWKRLCSEAPPPDPAGHGRGLSGALVASLASVIWLPTTLEVPGLAHADRDPSLYMVEADSVLAVDAGSPETHDDMVIVDLRKGRTVLTVLGLRGEEVLLDFTSDAVTAWNPGAAPYAFVDSGEAAPLDLPAMDPVGWLSVDGAPAWLLGDVEELAESPSVVDRFAAVGAVLRFGSDLGDGPADAARAWLLALGKPALDGVQALALVRADRLADDIGGIDSVPATLLPAHARNIVRERDELQSVRRALRVSGAADELSSTLARLDREAGLHATTLSDALSRLDDDPDVERWGEVSWREPEAWWVGVG